VVSVGPIQFLDETLNQGHDAVVIKNPRMSFEKKKKKIGV